jgi:poly(hydroxyalkanoate) granule-associated protein
MVKKLEAMAAKKNASGAGLFDSALAGSVKESAQQIWLAGMGAFAKAQAEGKQVFDALVKEGVALQKKTQSAAEEKLSDVSSKMTSMADDVTAKAGKQWDKLESIFEERTAKAMKKLGVPSAKDVQALMDRVDALSAQVTSRARTAAKKTAA